MVKATELADRERRRPQGGQNGNAAREDGEPARPLVPFVAASRERVESFHDDTNTLQSATQQVVSNVDVPAIGFLASLVLEVSATGGDGSTTAAVANEDAPFNVLQNLALSDVNGNPLFGPLNGYAAYLVEKYGAYAFVTDAKEKPSFSDVATSGDFTFVLRIPVQISGRDALGSLANMNASQTYKLSYSLAAASTVYDTEPNTLPDVRVQGRIEVWTQPSDTSVTGRPQQTRPPSHGTTQYVNLATYNINSGQQVIRFSRVGNIIRTIIAVLRDSSNARSNSDWPDPARLEFDGSLIENVSQRYFRDRIAERYGFTAAAGSAGGLDTGVFVWEFSHDMDGKPGFEDRALYLHTTQATRLELSGDFGSSADQLQVITNDIAVPS